MNDQAEAALRALIQELERDQSELQAKIINAGVKLKRLRKLVNDAIDGKRAKGER